MRRRILKWAAVLVVLVLVSISLYWVHVYRQVRDLAVNDKAQVAEAIVVLGAAQYNGKPSKVFQARLDHAFYLYKKGYSKTIITTGSYGPDPNYSEAHVGTVDLMKKGVDAADIMTEQASLTTHDSIRAASRLLRSKGWKTALVVSDGFHLFRVKTMFEDEGITAYTSPAPASPIEASASQRFWYSMREVFLFSAYRLVDL
ncbi:MAG TPA: YdcF family protein [Terriglobia bacterium]|nr:YdcF family protein [Terriglobia bacterium]